jgi:putative Mg2+ transporter-C (MgtC) family protein
LPELDWLEVLLRLALAAALGGAIGLERELRDREAGFRTHLLVSLGAALFTLVSAYAWTDWRFSTPEGVVFDPTRISAQIVTGIGFIGAGAIIRHGISVRGLTTAATLWTVAAIGMASAAGYYEGAIAATALTLVVLWPLRQLAQHLFGSYRRDAGQLGLELEAGASVAALTQRLEQLRVEWKGIDVRDREGVRRVRVDVELPRPLSVAELADRLLDLDGVSGVQWTG